MKVINKKFKSRSLYEKFVRIMNDILKTYNLDIEKTLLKYIEDNKIKTKTVELNKRIFKQCRTIFGTYLNCVINDDIIDKSTIDNIRKDVLVNCMKYMFKRTSIKPKNNHAKVFMFNCYNNVRYINYITPVFVKARLKGANYINLFIPDNFDIIDMETDIFAIADDVLYTFNNKHENNKLIELVKSNDNRSIEDLIIEYNYYGDNDYDDKVIKLIEW